MERPSPEPRLPPAEPGWKSGVQLAKEFLLSRQPLNRSILQLKDRLTSDVRHAGYDAQDAERLVDDHLIGWRRPAPGGRSTLYLSPEAVSLLDLSPRNTVRPAETGWRSASKLMQEGRGANATLEKRLKALKTALISDMEAAGYGAEEAAMLVDDHLIGARRPTSGPTALHASPDAVRAGEDAGAVQRPKPEGERPHLVHDDIARTLLEATSRLEERGDKEGALRSYQQIARGFRGTWEERHARDAIRRLEPGGKN